MSSDFSMPAQNHHHVLPITMFLFWVILMIFQFNALKSLKIYFEIAKRWAKKETAIKEE